MKKIFLLLITYVFLFSCHSGDQWSAEKLRNWYIDLKESDSRFLSPLYYQGTDEKFHYFICRSMDSWVPIKVLKEEIIIKDEEPYLSASQADHFPGYYPVDPGNGFMRIENENKKL